jgi:hypothetical protein
MTRCRDFTASFTEAIDALHAAGFGREAEQILEASRIPTTSSLELTGAIGVATLRVQAGVGHPLPFAARRRLARLLREVRRSWPGLDLEPGG